ncbi:HlyD family secretion protein [Oleiharenicola sp. Vm1]|uniref:HlyD family secretion protein n=1 Tax=Oleiharenicola sp. Vm1 TaxID=3398393 RepID=UPI0039F58643
MSTANAPLPSETAPASPAHRHTPPPAKTAAAPAGARRAMPFVLGAVALGTAAWLGHFAWHAWHYEETENAYLVGHLHQISPQISGQVREVRVRDNQDVKAGDVLVTLDPLEFEIARQKADAALAQAKAQAAQIAAARAQADAQYTEASARAAQADAELGQVQAQLALARLSLQRVQQLLRGSGAVPQSDADAAQSNYDAAVAAVAAAEANQTAARAAVVSAQATQQSVRAQAASADAAIAVAAAALRDAERELAYTTLTAPSDGRVGNRNVEPGNRVTAGQTLLALAEPAPWIVANFKETQLAHMHPGQPVDISVDAFPGEKLHGRIDSFSPASGAQFALLPPDNATGNFNKVVQRIPVKIVLAPESLRAFAAQLRLGYSVIVDVRVR